jgi:bifunctional non-homologous end joining protein LigD
VSPESKTLTEIDGRRLTLTNLDKILYPEVGFTKADVIWYYLHIGPVLLPHLRDRPATFVRFPNGVDGQSFFEKHASRNTPDWVKTIKVPRAAKPEGAPDIEFVVIADLSTLIWAANLAALELHVPMWRSTRQGHYGRFDQMVFDLDPGAPADITTCSEVAMWIRADLEQTGLTPYAKTSGSKGLQLYVPLTPHRPWEKVHQQAHEIAQRIERDHPNTVVSRMKKDLRVGKVLIDWSQNHPVKTTIAPYSLRARPAPTVSTPVSWEEVEACASKGDPSLLSFTSSQVLERVQAHGDLFAPVTGSAPKTSAPNTSAPKTTGTTKRPARKETA